MKGIIYRIIIVASRIAFITSILMSLGSCSHQNTSGPAPHPKHDGIDVSHYQEEIDWELIAKEPRTQFAIVKATEGSSIQDKYFKSNVAEAHKYGIKVGAYHLLTLDTSPEAQAENFCKMVSKEDINIVPAIDVEPSLLKKKHADRIAQYTLRVSEIFTKKFGQKPMIYTTARVYNQLLKNEFSHHYLWIASYSRHCPKLKGKAHADIWQYTERGKMKGSKHRLDLNCFVNGTTLENIMLKS